MTTTVQYTRHQSVTSALSTRQRSRATHQPAQIDVHRVKSPGVTIMSRELPMPKINQIYSLNQAHATLLHCWNKLSAIARGSSSPNSLANDPTSAAELRLECHQWLDRWEQAFKAFLSNSMSSMAAEDLTQCRVLKANHLACTVLAGPTTAAFEAEFQAITELAGAVLISRKSQGVDRLSSGLDVRDPLCLVASRCRERVITTRANELLTRHYRTLKSVTGDVAIPSSMVTRYMDCSEIVLVLADTFSYSVFRGANPLHYLSWSKTKSRGARVSGCVAGRETPPSAAGREALREDRDHEITGTAKHRPNRLRENLNRWASSQLLPFARTASYCAGFCVKVCLALTHIRVIATTLGAQGLSVSKALSFLMKQARWSPRS
nr:hypothetical protein CFP56_37280 [Quercus suber]